MRRISFVRLWLFFLVGAVVLLSQSCGNSGQANQFGTAPAGTTGPPSGPFGTSPGGSTSQVRTEVVASGLSVPWALQFSPDGRLFFTEQPGRLRVMTNFVLQTQPVFDVTAVTAGGEAGLTGMTLDPNFANNHFIYIFFCRVGAPLQCEVDRLIEANGIASFDKTLLTFTEPQDQHTGGRLKVGPDGLLYLTVGDSMQPNLAQDLTSPHGKILRMNLDGTPAFGNPDPAHPLIYALGFRDPQGLAWDSSGQLYGTDNGEVANDEVNIIFAGGNYGWPICQGICNNPQFIDPIRLFTGQSVPPSGATFYNSTVIPQFTGSMFFATLGLQGNTAAHHLHRILFDQPGGTKIVQEEELFKDQFGRLRDVTEGPDGFLYFSTSNATVTTPGVDQIIRVRPQ